MTPIPLPEGFLRLPIAHRGLHDRTAGLIENSASAVSAAVAAGYGIEIDLQLSSDGVAMVFHDEDLDRLTDQSGPLNARTAQDLSAIRLKGSTDTIPTLTQILDLVAGRVPLLIEVKDQSLTMGATDARLEGATVQALSGYDGPVALMSFNPSSVHHLARLAPDTPRGIITSSYDPQDWAPLPDTICNRLRKIPDYEATASSFVSHEAADLHRPRLRDLKAIGATILCWTIRSAQAEAEARHVADNVTFEGYLPSQSG